METKTQTIRMTANIGNLMRMASMDSPGFAMGFALCYESLKRIAERAIEIDDKAILEELRVIGVVRFNEDKSKDG